MIRGNRKGSGMLVKSPLSEEISGEVMHDVLKAVVARVKRVGRDHDIPYVAGYSQNGETIYIDRHMPRSHEFAGRRIETDDFLVLHETVEKALLDELGLNYIHAHQIALRSERAAVEAQDIAWRDYDRFIKQHEKQIADERLTKVPNDLDLTPYRDERNVTKLQHLMPSGSMRSEVGVQPRRRETRAYWKPSTGGHAGDRQCRENQRQGDRPAEAGGHGGGDAADDAGPARLQRERADQKTARGSEPSPRPGRALAVSGAS
ncbi:hypothetical protein QFZ27_001594 [Inquilinus ginsengisoli]|uniref:hypothetical protein n=1 Tax=Inquilinus ginsengisoli TaxID=363840 RepID=UPI003D2341FB